MAGKVMRFEWDEEKERKNIRKHGIPFSVAARVFGDPCHFVKYDAEHSAAEDRWIAIGMVWPNILLVIYTVKGKNELYRIISARKANEHEEREYYNYGI